MKYKRRAGFRERDSEIVGSWALPVLAWCIENGIVEAAFFEITREGDAIVKRGGGWDAILKYAWAQARTIKGAT